MHGLDEIQHEYIMKEKFGVRQPHGIKSVDIRKSTHASAQEQTAIMKKSVVIVKEMKADEGKNMTIEASPVKVLGAVSP